MDHKVSIREILPGEERGVREFFERNLGLIDRFFAVAFGDALKSALKKLGTSLVAVCKGKIVGSASLRIHVYADKRIGLVDAIVTDKNLRGKGIGKSLLDEALSWLEKKECEIIYATADRFNSRLGTCSSIKAFHHLGFGDNSETLA